MKEIRVAVKPEKYPGHERPWSWYTGICGQVMGHNYWMWSCIDAIFREYDAIGSIVELGSGHGGLTVLFGLWCWQKKCPCLAFDINTTPADPIKPLLEHLGVEMMQEDFNSAQSRDRMREVWSTGIPTYLHCDGGVADKVNELARFVGDLPAGSIASTHDYDTTQDKALKVIEDEHGLERIMLADGWMKNDGGTGFWYKR